MNKLYLHYQVALTHYPPADKNLDTAWTKPVELEDDTDLMFPICLSHEAITLDEAKAQLISAIEENWRVLNYEDNN